MPMPSFVTLFARARAGALLAPAERAALKLIQAAGVGVVSFVVANGSQLQTAIQGGNVNVGGLLHDQVLVPALMAAGMAIYKFFSAQGDTAGSGHQAPVPPPSSPVTAPAVTVAAETEQSGSEPNPLGAVF